MKIIQIRKTSLGVKSKKEAFEIIQTNKILSGSDCLEIEGTRLNLLLYSYKK